ncbi:MAG: DUF1684 domain-containing protein [Betaproteobacteria bacterium]|nr:DUF1684 domain-containing protein [Betaproteobacteria bacterium]
MPIMHIPSTIRLLAAVCVLAAAGAASAGTTPDPAYLDELGKWRARANESLTRERGWLSIIMRDELVPGVNRIGSAPGNDVVLPKTMARAHLGTIVVDKDKARLTLAPGQKMRAVVKGDAGEEFTARDLVTGAEPVEWVTAGRLSLQIVKREDGKFVLRAADRESPRRKNFAGRLWYEPNTDYKLPARFVPHAVGATIPIANVRGEISYEKVAGSLEFALNGQKISLDALDDDGNLFIIFRDGTSGNGTYPPGRFLYVERPKDGVWSVDLNKAFNPPCAFSAFTTCPLPPPQNWLKTSVPVGERYIEKKF